MKHTRILGSTLTKLTVSMLLVMLFTVLVAVLFSGFGGFGGFGHNVLMAQSQTAVFENVFSGITLAQASAPLRNVGQTMHVVQVTFPAEAVAVAAIQVQFQFSRDGVNWRPAGPDIISAPVKTQGVTATDVIAYKAYYGAFRSIRINSAVNTPGGELMTVRYIGHMLPATPFITETADRWDFN